MLLAASLSLTTVSLGALPTTGATCTVNLSGGPCGGDCIVNVGDCEEGRCDINTGHCAGGKCVINLGYCGRGCNSIINTGRCGRFCSVMAADACLAELGDGSRLLTLPLP